MQLLPDNKIQLSLTVLGEEPDIFSSRINNALKKSQVLVLTECP